MKLPLPLLHHHLSNASAGPAWTVGGVQSLREPWSQRSAVQAVLYFRRALKLDRNYLSAWTLMGHEYVELQNTGAAIGAANTATATAGSSNPLQTRVLPTCKLPACSRGSTAPLLQSKAVRQGWCLRSAATVALRRGAEAYRRAVDVSPRDYRAWYGLGQTYELMKMPYFALYYFRR